MDGIKIPEPVLMASRRYEELKQIEKQTKAEMDMLKPTILGYLADAGHDIQLDQGALSLKAGKTKWEYSEAVEKQEERVEKMKETERQKGIATEVAGDPYIEYRAKK